MHPLPLLNALSSLWTATEAARPGVAAPSHLAVLGAPALVAFPLALGIAAAALYAMGWGMQRKTRRPGARDRRRRDDHAAPAGEFFAEFDSTDIVPDEGDRTRADLARLSMQGSAEPGSGPRECGDREGQELCEEPVRAGGHDEPGREDPSSGDTSFDSSSSFDSFDSSDSSDSSD